MDLITAKNLVEQYMYGWKEEKIEAVLATLNEDCIVTECYGPIYRGRDRVQLWMEKWLGEGNRVLQWDIHSFFVGENSAAFEWGFKCLWHGTKPFLEGSSIVQFRDEKIQSLREYATTAQLYEWNGTWRE